MITGFLSNRISLEITSADPEKRLRQLSERGIELSSVQRKNDLTYEVSVSRKDYRFLFAYCRKYGDTIHIQKQQGIYWKLKSFAHRPVLLIGIVVLLVIWMYIPTRVLFVMVDGNDSVPSRKILSAAESCDISFGAARKHVRSEQVKNRLLSAVPELEWVGINTSGCTATISVRERSTAEKPQEKAVLGHIIANRRGCIFSITTTKGTALCQVGQTVEKGDILVSGYTDNGLSIQCTQAEAEILADTSHIIEVISSSEALLRTSDVKMKWRCSLILGKKRINLWKSSGIYPNTCGRIYEEFALTLPGGFLLPIRLCVEKISFYEMKTVISENADSLSDFAERYLLSQMNTGRILDCQEELAKFNGSNKFTGTYLCREVIGKAALEEIGVNYE